LICATTEGLGGREQLHMDFKADDWLILGQNLGRKRDN
jgi:hypothetical protein